MNTSRGFVALTTAVIISAVLIAFMFTTGTSGFFSRVNAAEAEYKRVALGLAESCANTALLKIAQNYNYAGNEAITVGTDEQGRTETCTIKTVSYGAEDANHQRIATIAATASYPVTNGAYSSILISSKVQNPSYPPPALGLLTVIVVTKNDNGGTKQPADFAVSVVPAANASPNAFAGAGGSGTSVFMTPGAYTVSPSPVAGYVESDTGCSGSINPGQSLSCTITEDDIATTATLTVIANVKNDNGGTLLPTNFPLSLDGASVISGVPISTISPGVHTASASAAPSGYTASLWGADWAAGGTITRWAGQKNTCIIAYDDNQPPTPICVDTVMMLDRTGSMNSTDLSDERTAANGLLNLYKALTPLPKSAVGVFGAVNANEPYNAAIVQTLTTAYSSLTNAVNTNLANSGGYTNIASAISTAQAEFTAHGTPGKGHVLILLSDGGANRPTGTMNADTGWKLPSATSTNAVGDFWTNPEGAYSTGDASDAGGHRERYSALGLSVPAGATVTGIEVQPTAWSSSAAGSPTTVTLGAPTGTGNYTQWSTGGFLGFFGAVYAISTNDADTSYVSTGTNGNAETFVMPGAGLPAGVSINSVTLTALVATQGGSANVKLRVEKGTGAGGQSDDGGTAVTSGTYTTISRTMGTNPFTSAAWTVAEVNAWTTRFGVVRNNASGGTPRVTQLYLTVNYNPPPVTCTLGIDLSYDAGAHWVSEKTQPLTTSAKTYTLGASNDTWGRSWGTGDFSDANFRVRIHDTNSGPTCHVDVLQTRVSYSIPSDPYEAALDAADTAKAAGTQIFTIHYGSNGNANHDINFLANLASGSSAVTYNGTPHLPGSVNDLGDTPASGNTGLRSPTTTAAPNQFTNPTRAYSSDNQYATDTVNGHQQGYGTFSLNVPTGATLNGIEVNVEAKSSDSSGCQIGAAVSWDGGTTWSSQKTANLTNSDVTYTLGSTADTWGHPWQQSELAGTKFVVRLQDIDPGNNCTNNSTLSVDQVQVRATYTGGVPENGDSDDFFVSPTSGDMAAIFQVD